MDNSFTNNLSSNKVQKNNVMNVMKTLKSFVNQEMQEINPLKVTYISNIKPKIIKWIDIADESTDEE